MRSGCRSASTPPGRAVSCGSSSSTLFTPHMIASMRVRKPCAHARASSPATQRESPLAAAIFPSSVAANFAMTNGRPVVRCFTYASSSLADSDCAVADRDFDAGGAQLLRRRGRRRRGSGSIIATCTSRTPAAISASVQGGVRPWWACGSSVTYAVAPRAASPAAAQRHHLGVRPADAAASRPRRRSAPSRTITQPTLGFGLVDPSTDSASSSARSMCGDVMRTGYRTAPSPWTIRLRRSMRSTASRRYSASIFAISFSFSPRASTIARLRTGGAAAERVVVQRLGDALGEHVRPVERHAEAVDAVLDPLALRRQVRDDREAARRHRLQQRDRRPVRRRHRDEDLRIRSCASRSAARPTNPMNLDAPVARPRRVASAPASAIRRARRRAARSGASRATCVERIDDLADVVQRFVRARAEHDRRPRRVGRRARSPMRLRVR